MTTNAKASSPSTTAPAPDRVGELARTGGMWSALLVIARQVVTTAATVVVSRHLTSADYGIVAMVMTLTVLLTSFSDIGLSWATIQRKHLSRAQVDNLFWINTAVGGVLALACAGVAPLVAGFYDEPDIATILPVLSVTFVFSGLAAQPAALMSRQMRFKRLVLIDLASVVAGATMAVVFALQGWGYWALIGQSVVGAVLRSVLVVAGARYRPGRPRLGTGTTELVWFGSILALNMINFFFARNLDNIIIGKVKGATELGYYSRAYYLMSLPLAYTVQPLARVMIPALSALQHDRHRMGGAYRTAVRLTSFVGVPFALGLAVAAPEAVRLIYGPDWAPVVPILTWLALAGALQPIYTTHGWLFISSGKGGQFFAESTITVLILAVAFAVGIRWGGLGVAIAYAIAMTFFIVGPSLLWSHRVAQIPLRPTLAVTTPVVLAGLVMAIAAWCAGLVATELGFDWPIVLIAKVGVGGIVYCLVALRFVRPLPLEKLESAVQRAESRLRALSARR